MFISENKKHRFRLKIFHFSPYQSFNYKSLIRPIQDMRLTRPTVTIITTHLARTMYANQYLPKVHMSVFTSSLAVRNTIHVIDTLNLKRHNVTAYFNGEQISPFISNWP